MDGEDQGLSVYHGLSVLLWAKQIIARDWRHKPECKVLRLPVSLALAAWSSRSSLFLPLSPF